jgi:hypothetical protein
MLFLIVLTTVAVTVAVVALQNGHAVAVSFLFWQGAFWQGAAGSHHPHCDGGRPRDRGTDRVRARPAPLEPPPSRAECKVRGERSRRSSAYGAVR